MCDILVKFLHKCQYVQLLIDRVCVVNADGQQIVTVAHDRTIKIWSCKSSTQDNAMELD